MRNIVVAGVLVASAFAVGPPPAVALPPIHIEVPPIQHAIEAGRPLTEADWADRTPEFEQRLSDAGSVDALAVEETLRDAQPNGLREALKRCLEGAARADFEAKQEGKSFSFSEALAVCLAGQLPESTPEAAKEQFTGWLVGVIGKPTDDAALQRRPLNTTIAWPSLNSSTTTTAAVDLPPDDGGGFPGLLVGVGALVAVGGLAFALRRS